MRHKVSKLLSSLLALCMALALFPATASAAGQIPEISIKWVPGEPDSYNRDLNWLTIRTGEWTNGADWGNAIIDLETGTEIDEYNIVYAFSEDLAIAGKGEWIGDTKWGYIDRTGAVVVPLEYDRAEDFSEGLAKVEKNGKYRFIDKTNAMAVSTEYDWAGNFSEGLAAVGKNGKYGYIDRTGAMVVPLKYDWCYDFSESLAAVEKDFKWGFIDKTGAVVVPMEYDGTWGFSEGLAAVEKDFKWGFIDKTGAVVVPLEYDWCYNFSEGLAMVLIKVSEGKTREGYIDRSGAVVVPLEYSFAEPFSDGLAIVEKWVSDEECKCGFIDKTGAVVLPLEYDSAGITAGDHLYWVRKGEKYGVFASPYAESSSPSTPSTPAVNAVLSSQRLTVNGVGVSCEKYNIDGSNYFKLRDLAYILSGTGSRFEVGYDQASSTVAITAGAAYTPAGGELETGADNSATAQPSNQAILINGEKHDELTVYNIGGSNFFQLRELGDALGFDVGYDGATNTATVRSR